MGVFLVRRFAYSVLTLLGVSFVVFVLIRALPGEPIDYYRSQLGSGPADAAALEAIRRSYALDGSAVTQYAAWFGRALRGDLGHSFIDHEPVGAKIAERAGATLTLNLTALLISFSIAVPLGVWLSGRRRRGEAADLLLLVLFSLPAFWIALLLIDALVVRSSLLPLFGMESISADSLSPSARVVDRVRHMLLPVVCLSIAPVAMIARVTRAAMIEAFSADHIVAARARGLSDRALKFKHALRVAAVPLISLFGVLTPFALSGSVVIERIFQWGGVGSLLIDSILRRDYPVVMGATLFTALIVLASSVIVDVLYAWADPRIRSGEEVA